MALDTQEKKLAKLEQLLRFANTELTREDFDKAFLEVLKIVRAIKDDNTKTAKELRDLYGAIIEKADVKHSEVRDKLDKRSSSIEVEHNKRLAEFRKWDGQFQSLITEIEKAIKGVKNGRDGADGKDGKNATDSPKDIRNALESLGGDDRLDKSAIRGLEEQIKELTKQISERPIGRIGGMRKVPITKRYNLSDQCDGATKTFTLPQDTTDVHGVWGTQFPVTFNPLTDWTLNGRTLTLTDEVGAPETGQTLWCLIETLFY